MSDETTPPDGDDEGGADLPDDLPDLSWPPTAPYSNGTTSYEAAQIIAPLLNAKRYAVWVIYRYYYEKHGDLGMIDQQMQVDFGKAIQGQVGRRGELTKLGLVIKKIVKVDGKKEVERRHTKDVPPGNRKKWHDLEDRMTVNGKKYTAEVYVYNPNPDPDYVKKMIAEEKKWRRDVYIGFDERATAGFKKLFHQREVPVWSIGGPKHLNVYVDDDALLEDVLRLLKTSPHPTENLQQLREALEDMLKRVRIVRDDEGREDEDGEGNEGDGGNEPDFLDFLKDL